MVWEPPKTWEPEKPTWQPDQSKDDLSPSPGLVDRMWEGMREQMDKWHKSLFAPETEIDRKEEERKKRRNCDN